MPDEGHVLSGGMLAFHTFGNLVLEKDDRHNPHGWSAGRKLYVSIGVVIASFVP